LTKKKQLTTTYEVVGEAVLNKPLYKLVFVTNRGIGFLWVYLDLE
jgi:hypothetical protein